MTKFKCNSSQAVGNEESKVSPFSVDAASGDFSLGVKKKNTDEDLLNFKKQEKSVFGFKAEDLAPPSDGAAAPFMSGSLQSFGQQQQQRKEPAINVEKLDASSNNSNLTDPNKAPAAQSERHQAEHAENREDQEEQQN